MDIRRGDIFYVTRDDVTYGSEQRTGRPAIVVSNDRNNVHSGVIEVVYLTTKEKPKLPTHVEIRSSKHLSTALCEQINSVCKSCVGDFVGTCTEEEMYDIDAALAVSVGIYFESDDTCETTNDNGTNHELIRMEIERDTYKKMYEDLIERMMKN